MPSSTYRTSSDAPFLVSGGRNEDAEPGSFNVFEHDNKHITSRGLSHHPSITLSTIDSSTYKSLLTNYFDH